jgi:hypothetical protein
MDRLVGSYVVCCIHTLSEQTLTCSADGNIELSKEGVEKLGKSTEGLLHVNGDHNKGYVAAIEVFHYLHCLVSTLYNP